MVLNHPPCHPGKGEYPVQAEDWQANPYDHPLYGLTARRLAQPRARVQKQVDCPIEEGKHYLALVRGKDGRDHFKSSDSLRHVKRSVLSKIIRDFQEAVRLAESDGQARPSNDPREQEAPRNQPVSIGAIDSDTGSISYPFRRKRARANTESGSLPRSVERGSKNARVQAAHDGSKKLISIQLHDEEALKKWYIEAFEAVQQVTCRTIAKLWIKKIEPKKQSAHPYNGGLPKEDPKDPERTKPAYWPDNIPHKEPDHIQKNQRITLLTHLITKTPIQQLVPKDKPGEWIGAAELEAQSEERKNDFPPDKWEILWHIFRVRKHQEAYLNGGQDGETYVEVPDCSKATRLEQGEPEKEVEDSEADLPLTSQASDEESEGTEHAGPAIMTPVSSTTTASIDQRHVQGHNTVINSASSSFSDQGGDMINNSQQMRQHIRCFDESFDRSMAGELMERRTTNSMTYAHHGLPQQSYSQLSISQPHYPQQSMHPPTEHHETQRWADYSTDVFNHVSHLGAPVQSESVMSDYGLYSNADIGSMATTTSGLPCTEDFYQQARIEQIQRQLHHQGLVSELTSQPHREIPYRSASAQSAQRMALSRDNSYDHAVVPSSFYHHI